MVPLVIPVSECRRDASIPAGDATDDGTLRWSGHCNRSPCASSGPSASVIPSIVRRQRPARSQTSNIAAVLPPGQARHQSRLAEEIDLGGNNHRNTMPTAEMPVMAVTGMAAG